LEHRNLLAFKSHNGTLCSLLQVPSSSNFDNFKRNARATRWLQEVSTVAGVGSLEENAQWTIQHLGVVYSDSFIAAACNLGVLLHSKKMDAESSCAMWEEANVALRGERIILRHLGKFFGRGLTVPE